MKKQPNDRRPSTERDAMSNNKYRNIKPTNQEVLLVHSTTIKTSHLNQIFTMGKGWKGRGGGGRGGGGGGAHHDLKSVQGHACILGTCDSARVKEGNREMLNLVSEAIEELYPNLDEAGDKDAREVGVSSSSSSSSSEQTVSDLLKEELEMLKKARLFQF